MSFTKQTKATVAGLAFLLAAGGLTYNQAVLQGEITKLERQPKPTPVAIVVTPTLTATPSATPTVKYLIPARRVLPTK